MEAFPCPILFVLSALTRNIAVFAGMQASHGLSMQLLSERSAAATQGARGLAAEGTALAAAKVGGEAR